MTTHPPILALGFTRGVGKDTLTQALAQLDPRVTRYAFADPLKADLAPFLLEHFGINVWSCTAEEKEIIRPVLIGYGMAQRARDPDYWVKRTVKAIKQDLAQTRAAVELFPVITDVRFYNEMTILRRDLGARIVHVTRDGAPPPTDEEAKHYASLIPQADFHFHWGNDDDADRLLHASRLLGWLNAEIEQSA